MATMIVRWIEPCLLIFIAMQMYQCCYHRDIIYESDSRKLMAVAGDPPRMIGWEQMILMFKGPIGGAQQGSVGYTEEDEMKVRILYYVTL